MNKENLKKISNNNFLNNNLVELIQKSSVFNLQFRRDVRYERLNHPAYYRWKAQFIVVSNTNRKKLIYNIKSILNCGKIYSNKNQIKYIIQKIDDLYNIVIPFLKDKIIPNNSPTDIDQIQKKLNLWIRAVKIIYRYKGKKLTAWNKKDLQDILEIHKLMHKNKNSRKFKWISVAKNISINL